MKGDTTRKNITDIRSHIMDFMTSRDCWEENMDKEVPSAVENYGGLLLFSHPAFSHTNWHEAGDDLWQLVCDLYKGNRIAIKGRVKDDLFRTPRAKLIFGSSPIVTFTDNRIRYRWNIEKTMFSRGNVTERHRIARLDCRDEVIVDLYAGIGYFTLPYLIHAKAQHVHACEWNPDAIRSLRGNLELNNVDGMCTIYEGDNRVVCPKKVANRVNLGLIPSSEKSWETACQALLPTGGLLYVHQNVESNVTTKSSDICVSCDRLQSQCQPIDRNAVLPAKIFSNPLQVTDGGDTIRWRRAEWFRFSLHLSHVLLDYVETYHGGDWQICVDDVFRVKSYAPHIDHLVYSVRCEPFLETS